MVREHYARLGFERLAEAEDGSTTWRLDLTTYTPRPTFIASRNAAETAPMRDCSPPELPKRYHNDRSRDLRALNAVFRQVLEDDSIELTPTTTAEDVEGWDSMSNHIFIVVELEKRFGVKFQAAEMEELKNVGELAALVQPEGRASAVSEVAMLFNSLPVHSSPSCPSALLGFLAASGARVAGGRGSG